MNVIARISSAALFSPVCAACSQSQNPPPAPVSTALMPAPPSAQAPARAIPMVTPVSTGSSATADVAPPASGLTLARLMQRPEFAKAFESMDGASQLPAWVREGGVATPSRKVQVDGKTMWLVHACESSQCDTGELWLLIDADSHTMQGLFQAQTGQNGATVGKLVWLGNPDAAVRTFLKEHIAGN